MDDSTTSSSDGKKARIPLGMSAFGEKERQQFGQNIRLAMECIEGKTVPVKGKAMPSDESAIRHRLKTLSQDITSNHADLLELLVRFDDLQGWKSSGASHCAAWMNFEIGISMQLGWEYLRVGRKLRSLPTTTALFRAGKIAWSKIRLIVNVANKDNEKTLSHAAIDASVTGVKRLCDGYRWQEDDKGDDNSRGENERALQQWESRSLYWDEASNGSTRIRLTLPPEIAQAFLNSVKHSLNQLEDSESKMSQRRADAAVLMAETSLQSAGREIATADRYQVIVSVDASELSPSPFASPSASDSDAKTKSNHHDVNAHDKKLPPKRSTIKGAGPIARETARRIACDCSVSVNAISNGEPVDIGRKSRIWPTAMARAIKDRDQHCQYPGCCHTQNLQIHHIRHWADGGTTCVSNAASLCSYHHTLVHEGAYTIQHVGSSEQRLSEQFAQQQRTEDESMFDFEKDLRNDRESFEKVRMLLPTSYRFRVMDADGRDVQSRKKANTYTHRQTKPCADVHTKFNTQTNTQTNANAINFRNSSATDNKNSDCPNHSTRVECAEPGTQYYRYSVESENCVYVGDRDRDVGSGNCMTQSHETLFVAEHPPRYHAQIN